MYATFRRSIIRANPFRRSGVAKLRRFGIRRKGRILRTRALNVQHGANATTSTPRGRWKSIFKRPLRLECPNACRTLQALGGSLLIADKIRRVTTRRLRKKLGRAFERYILIRNNKITRGTLEPLQPLTISVRRARTSWLRDLYTFSREGCNRRQWINLDRETTSLASLTVAPFH